MTKHNKPFTNFNNNDNNIQVEKNILEETVDSKKLSIIEILPNLPSNNGNMYDTKLFKSEAKISKLISEIDLLKKKVS